MPTVRDVQQQIKFLLDHGRAEEPAKLVLPRIEAQRRVVNKIQRTRVQFDCDPKQYSLFWNERKRIVEHCVNVTMATDVMNKWLAKLTPEIMDLIVEGGFDEEKG